MFHLIFCLSDHWHSNPKPTYALLEFIGAAIDSSDTSYRQGLPPIFDCLGVKQPPSLTGIIIKVNRYVAKAVTTWKFLPLCQEAREISKTQTETVGPACSLIGVTPEWLRNGVPCTATVTNHVIFELLRFRNKEGITWKTVQNMWWAKLFPSSNPPQFTGTIISNWEAVAKKRQVTCPVTGLKRT